MQTSITLLGTLGLSLLAQVSHEVGLPQVASLGASGSVIAVLIWLLSREKAEKAEQRKEFLEALRANTASVERLSEKVDRFREEER